MSSGHSMMTTEYLNRSNVWSRDLKQLLLDDLMAMKFVRNLTDFPDGSTFNIPSLGEAEVTNYVEGQAVKYNKLDEGNFTFSWDMYQYSAHSVTEKFKRDSYYAQDVLAAFVPREHRALMEQVEARILSRGPVGQTSANLNNINGRPHRWVARGTGNIISIADFIQARLSLTVANVPKTNLVAILDPTAIATLQSQANVVNLMTPSPTWQQVLHTGATTGFRFAFSVLGFDIYESNYLYRGAAGTGISETIDGTAVTNGVANLFFSATQGDTMPIIGGFRQMPTVYSEFNKDLQQEEHLTICEYGYALYRPENMIVVISDTTAI